MSKIGLTIEQINTMQPESIVRNENVRDKFIQIYEAMWTPSTGVSGEAAYERESRNFNRLHSIPRRGNFRTNTRPWHQGASLPPRSLRRH